MKPVRPSPNGRELVIVIALLGVFSAACGKGDKQGDSEKAPPEAVRASASAATGANAVAAPSGQAGARVPEAPPRGPEHPVYSFFDNRLSAHLQHAGGLAIDAGSAGFARYMRFGRSRLSWTSRQERDEHHVAVMSGKTGRLIVPLAPAQAAGAPRIRFRLYSPVGQRLGLRINGDRKAEVSIPVDATGWSTVEATLAAGQLKAGENEILLFASEKPIELQWMTVGGTGTGDELSDFFTEDGISLRDGDGVAYYVMVPEDARVTGDLSAAGCQLAVTATDTAGKEIQGTLTGTGAAVELGGLAGEAARIELSLSGCEQATVRSAALTVPGPAKTLTRSEPPRHVLLLIMDSLRADRVRPFNPKARPETPTFEALSKKATFFTQAYVQGNESRASHASLWTSTYPAVHGMIPGVNPSKIDTRWFTIDELMNEVGAFDFGVSANGYITPRRGFGTKWNQFTNHIHDGGGLDAASLLDGAWKFLAGKEKDLWFGYLGWIDTHVSWRGHEPWLSKYMDKGYSGPFETVASGKAVEGIATGKVHVTEADKQQMQALYDSNVSYQDHELGELLKKLDELGIADDTMLVIIADHGDELFEDGRVGHGGSLREELVHVPFVIYYPKEFPAGLVTEGAEAIDIVPTLADVFGVDMDPSWQGESLLPIAQGVNAGYPRMSFASQYEDVHVGRIGRWKLRVGGAGSPALYDVIADPLEREDVSAERPIETRMLADAYWMLRAYNKEWRKWKWGNAANVEPAFAASFGE